jgi:hypothetical protein
MVRISTTQKLAEAVGVTPQRIYQLRRSGLLEQAGRNQWNYWHNIGLFAAYKSVSRHPGRPSIADRSEGCDPGIQSIFDFESSAGSTSR